MTHASAAQGALVKERTGLPGAGGERPLYRRRPLLALAGLIVLLALATAYHFAIYVPQPASPHLLTLLDDVFAVGVFGLVGLAGLVLGLRVLRPFRLAGFSRLERGALALGLGWGMLSLAVLALGLAHLLYAWVLYAGLALALLLSWREVWRLWALLATPVTYRLPRRFLPHGFFEVALVVALLIEVAFLSVSWLAPYPAMAYDLYQYHWAVPKLFLLNHAIYALPGWAHANFPFSDEMLNTIVLAVQAPVAALLLQGTFGLLAVLLLAGYLYRHFGRTAAWLGVALCLGSPLYLSLLTDGYVELALSYDAVAAVVVLLAWLEQPTQAGIRGNLRQVLLVGLFAGLGLAAKYTQAQIVLGVGLLLVAALALSGWRAWRQGEWRRQTLGYGLLALLLYGVGAAAPVLSWLAKDWALLGNPIYPFIWGGPEWNAARTEVGVVTFAHFGPRGPLWLRLLEAFFGLFFDTTRTGESYLIPPNYLLLSVLALPPLLVGTWYARRKQGAAAPKLRSSPALRRIAPWLVVAGGAYVAWALSNALVGRYAMPWLLLLAVPAAFVLMRLLQWSRRRRVARMLAQVGILALVFTLGTVLSSFYWLVDNPTALIAGQVSLQQWEKQNVLSPDYWAMVNYVDTSLPRSAKILLLGQGTGYFLEGREYIADSGEDWIPYLETEGHTQAGMVALLRQEGFRYVVYNEVILHFVIKNYNNSYLATFLPSFRQFLSESLIQVWHDKDFSVYQVPPP